MKINCIKTRWYFSARLPDKTYFEGYVEYHLNNRGKKVVGVYDSSNGKPVWSSTGVTRTDGRSAKMSFGVYIESSIIKNIKIPSTKS